MKKLLLLLLISNLPLVSVFAQVPSNDNCSGAIVLTVNNDNLCAVTLTGTTVGATESQAGCNFTAADDDVWYKFTATATSHKIQVVSNSGTLQNPVFEVFSGACGGLSSLGCVNNQNTFYDTEQTILTSLVVGNEYFIRVHSGGSSTLARGTFTICVGVPVPPANDECAGATTLLINPNQSCTIPNSGNSSEATLSLAGCSPGSNADDDVWFEFTATSTVHKITLTAGTIKSPVLELFSGVCGGLSSIYCMPAFVNNFSIGELTVGQKYFIRVYSYYGGLSQAGTFSICINEGTGMPSNDVCSGAIGLTANNASCNVVNSGTTANASGSMNASCVGDPIQNDVWYKFTATNTEMILKLLNSTLSSATMELFSGSCGIRSSLACSIINNNFISYTNFVVGQEYYLRVWERQGSSGTFDLCLSTTLNNDNSALAAVIPINTDFTCTQKINGDNSLALSNETSNNGCPTIVDGIWYKFVANNDSLTIELTAIGMGSGSRFELFHKQGSNLIFLEEQQNKFFKTNFTIGDEYFILVYTCNSLSQNRGTFELCVRNFPPPPANDRCENAQVVSVNPNLTCSLKATGTTINALAGISSNCSGDVDDDVWYRFIATNAKHSISVTPSTLEDAVFQVFEGNCESLSDLNCTNNTSGSDGENGKVGNLVVGDTYYVRVFSSNVGTGQGVFDICVNLPIANEDCEDAISLTPGATCTAVSGSTAGVTTDRYDNCDFYKYGVYYKFTAAGSSQIIRLTRGTIQNVYIDVLQNNCGSTDRIGSCGNPSNAAVVDKAVSGLTIGTDYLIWINTEEISEEGSFDICVLNTDPPLNDECASGPILTVNVGNIPAIKTLGSTQFATQSLAGCSGNADDDVWYSFTATQTSHRVFLQKNSSFENIVLQIFSGSCESLVSKQCISSGFDDTKNSSALLTSLNVGETYFVRVYYQGIVPGSFSIAITSVPQNDNCASAFSLTPSAADTFVGAVTGSSFDATKSFNSYQGSSVTDDDVWYSFTATQKVHRIKLKGWKSDLAGIEVYSGDCNSLVAVSCSTSISVPQCDMGSLTLDTLILTTDKYVPGQVYRFRVFSVTSSLNQSLFDVAVTSPFVVPFDDCTGAINIAVSATATCANPTIINTKGLITSSSQSGSCNFGGISGQPEKDIYLKFTATAIQHRISVNLGQGGPIPYQVLSGTCGALVAQGCSQDLDSLSSLGNLIVGQTYFIRVLMIYNNIDALKICISTPQFDANDECGGAILVNTSGNADACVVSYGTLNNSSQSVFETCNTAGNTKKKIMKDVWYKFIASGTSHRVWLSNVSDMYFDPTLSTSGAYTRKLIKFELYGGACENKTYVGCSSDIKEQEEKVFQNLTVGQTYFLKVTTFERGDFKFQFCIKNTVPPANDVCASASNLNVFATWNSNNYTKGTTSDATATIGSNTCGAANSLDVWYKFNATNTSHTVAFRSNSSSTPITGLTVAVYSGDCSLPVHLACKVGVFTSTSDDFLNLTNLTIGQLYFIKVYSSTATTASQGAFDIQVLNISTPSNDNCSNPINLTVQNSSVSFSSTLTETVFATTSVEAIACATSGTEDDDVWFSFTPSQSSVRLLLTANFVNPVFVLYSGTCGGLTSITCGSAGESAMSINTILNNLSPNTPYLFRVYSASNTLRGRVFVGLTNDTVIPPNDLCQNAESLIPSANNTPTFTSGTTVNAQNNNSQCFAGNEVWYKFVATSTTHYFIFDGFLKDPAIVLFTGTCNSFTIVPNTCFAGIHGISFVNSGLTIGTTYHIKIAAQVANAENQGNFKIAITTPSVPSNDNCANALPLETATGYQSTYLATNENSAGSCGVDSKDIWYKFTATATKMNLDIENLNTDAFLAVFTGACPSPTLVKCSILDSPDQGSWTVNTLNVDNLVVGNEYLVKVAAQNSNFYMDFKIRLYNHEEVEANSLFEASCIGTNLVSNPSFENPEECPTNFVPTPSAPGQTLIKNLGWTIPSSGSSDYFNSCALFNANIEAPRNRVFGIQSPRNGLGYAGFFAGGSEYREYLHTKLSSPMIIGKKYLLSMYVSRADYYAFASNNVGFGLSLEQIVQFSNDNLTTDRVLLPISNPVIHEKDQWVNIALEYTADQAYEHLYLGNFYSRVNTVTQLATDISGGTSGGYGGQSGSNNSYYFVDDVVVTKVSNTIACGANNCESAITLVSPTDNISGATVTKSTNLELKANITIQGSSNVLFQSNKSILMDAAQGVFEVKNGVVFEAKIGGCVN